MRNRYSAERRFADFYRYYVGDFRQDIPIYLDLAAKFRDPILEVGCGTGRVGSHLAAAGYQVLGIDTSRPMLEVAHDYLKPWEDRARILNFDIRHSPLPERFQVALVTLHTFNLLIDVEEQRLFLRHLRQSVASPGVLVLDLFCPLFLARPDSTEDWRTLDRTCGEHRLMVRDKRQMLTPLLERRTQCFQLDQGPETELVTHRRFVTPSLAAQLLEEAGFEGVLCVKDYDLASASPPSEVERVSGPFMLIAEG